MLPFRKKMPKTGEFYMDGMTTIEVSEDDVWMDKLRQKWGTVPGDVGQRLSTQELLKLSDCELHRVWESCVEKDNTDFSVRGWYHTLYNGISNQRIIDVGSGFGIDGITLAMQGNYVTFVDIVQSNLEVIKRLCRILNLTFVSFEYMDSLESLRAIPMKYDVVWAQGSLINAPYEQVKKERSILCDHLKTGGRWIELCYPKSRWIRDRKPQFTKWGEMTDGKGTPWVEWYDFEKMQKALSPSEFQVVLYQEFHNKEFNWFDLLKK